jgi:hypothetical protein
MLQQPYKRIARPFETPSGNFVGGQVDQSYLVQSGYATDRTTLIRGYHALESDLERLFEYVEPDDRNLGAFSTRTYELLLRASTEFEANCKAILTENGYSRAKNLNMIDYSRIEGATHLSRYKLRLTVWARSPREIQPLEQWSSGNPLQWYQAYNSVKHNRVADFHQANLKNAVDAVASLFAILFAQFNVLAFSAHELVSSYDEWNGWLAHPNSIFQVNTPRDWNINECYGFTGIPAVFNSYQF